MSERIGGIRGEAVESATGHDWQQWLEYLDARDGTACTHKERVAMLAAAGVESGWWQQQLAVGYEQARGLREVGETATSGFQVGCQRTLPVSKALLWEFMTSPEGQAIWLGDGSRFSLEPGKEYTTAAGTTGEIRTRVDGERLRVTYHPSDWDAPSTLQFTLQSPQDVAEKTTLRFHHEKLADGDTRDAMRDHWHGVLDDIEAAVTPRA